MRRCTKCLMEKDWSQFNKQSNGLNGKASVCKNCRNKIGREKYKKNKKDILTPEYRKKAAINAKSNRTKMRNDVISHYGGKCACCGEKQWEFLVIDHIFGGGEKHRSSLGCNTGGYPFYAKLKKMNYPFKDELRVLCCNCNSALGYYGYCPHHKNINITEK